ncbi:MAG: helix-turn-helix domain-containing protein [Deltaproteobacteria bacterium]
MHSILLTKEVAGILRVGEEYVRHLIRRGKIRAYKEGRRGGFRITQEEVDRYIRLRQREAGRPAGK